MENSWSPACDYQEKWKILMGVWDLINLLDDKIFQRPSSDGTTDSSSTMPYTYA